MKDFFKPEDFSSIMSNEGLAKVANEKLNKLIESAPDIYGKPGKYPCNKDEATHKAKMMFIEEIKKEPCKHEPNEIEITMNYEGGIYSPRLGTFDIKKLGDSKFRSIQSICKHCGVELQATWSEKKNG